MSASKKRTGSAQRPLAVLRTYRAVLFPHEGFNWMPGGTLHRGSAKRCEHSLFRLGRIPVTREFRRGIERGGEDPQEFLPRVGALSSTAASIMPSLR